ncbi:cytochrome P450 71A1-like [Arachis ipaensis]|uniref:cytochrome P450 71A1-like n=1 Tax=Arachis ipaensis TaxID=130454 RepID=UPI000A2B9273|nr:cytochrome P450 71A1-like [Arachis ipaensis]
MQGGWFCTLWRGMEKKEEAKLCVLELLSTNRVKSFQPIRENEISMMINSIHEACTKGLSVNLSKMIVATSTNISSRCIFGLRFETSDDGRKSIAKVVRKMMSQFLKLGVGDLFPSLDWVDVLTGFMSRLKVTFAELDAFLEEVIEEHKRKKKNCDDNNKDFVDVLLQLQERDMLEFELNGDTMKSLLLDLFVGGSDTVSTTIEWAFAELANHPKIMKKVQEEVRRIVGGKSKIEENDLNQMKYMKCVIKETLRLHPPGPLLIPRETANSVEIKGYHIPKKVTVYINSYAIHRDPKLWDNAEEFIPERFEGNQQVDYKVKDFQLIPFGFGRRGCPGISFGIASVEYMMANLLYWFDWKDLLVAGGDTVSSIIEWAFAELANNPKVMKKVQEEVRRIVGGKSKIEENDINQMKYMKCVIKETLRLHPPGPFLIPRETANSVEIKGYHIPKKVAIYINSYAIHRDPKLWDNAEEFIPERFEGNQQVDYKVKDFQLIPFGIGRRGCPGISFGVASVEYMMANLLYWFDWKVPNNNKSALIDMSEFNGLSVTKKQPLYLEPMPYLIC